MATDWTRGYTVDYEYWTVDPLTYRNRRKLPGVESCEITRDASDDTLGHAVMTVSELLPEETWVRAYLLATQRGETERVCLGTFLAIGTRMVMDGKASAYPLDLHTPLKELADDGPPDGYPVRKGANAVAAASSLFGRFHVRLAGSSASPATARQVVASGDSWLTLGRKVLAEAGMEPTLDASGAVGFAPKRDAAALAPVWTFADDEDGILGADAELACGWGGVPNVFRVSLPDGAAGVLAEAVNDDPSSATSTVSRGRTVSMAEDGPGGVATAEQAAAYAARRLREESCAERTLTFTHGYCPVRLGDCVRVVYGAHGLDARAKVTRQVIRCVTDLEVECDAVYSEEAWHGQG